MRISKTSRVAFTALLIGVNAQATTDESFGGNAEPNISLRAAWLLDETASVEERKLRLEIAKHQSQLEAEISKLRLEKTPSDFLEYFKLLVGLLNALAWPSAVVYLLWRFRPYIEDILEQFGSRLRTAENVRVGLMGQEFQISGTAKELQRERESRLQTGELDATTEEALTIEAATRELNNPMADLIGIMLLSAAKPVTLEALTKGLMQKLSPKEVVSQQAPFVIVMMSKQVEKMLAALKSLNYVSESEGLYMLTQSGTDFFKRVQERFGSFMARFQALV